MVHLLMNVRRLCIAGDHYEGPPIFDDDQYEEESMSVYDTDIEDVIEEEEGFIEKGGFGGKEDNIEDVVVVANDLCSSMIQTTLNVDFEEDINTKSHELVSFAKNIIIKRENEEALKKVEMEMMLERQLAAKQNMEMQIEELKVTLQVMKRLGDDDVQELINKMNDDLEAKMKEISDIEEMNQALIVMERQRNDELQARKELIKVLLSDVLQISIILF
ncbi:hypothetical protein Tco_1295447 [Tanacetum coccineum]